MLDWNLLLIVIYGSSNEENSKLFFYGDSGKKVFMHFFFFLLTYCLTLMVLTTLTLVGFFLSTASPVGGSRLVDQRSDGDHTKSESEQRLVFQQ